ncbi:hypothetical protein NIES4073_09040 [Kalymmatonema gypsitolerans NIES-4073]|nr:hypothetical protein NIES4073_09040 [Scytonema sp. NIES-4073]
MLFKGDHAVRAACDAKSAHSWGLRAIGQGTAPLRAMAQNARPLGAIAF